MAHSEAQGKGGELIQIQRREYDRKTGRPKDRERETEDLTWDSIVVPRLVIYYSTAVK